MASLGSIIVEKRMHMFGLVRATGTLPRTQAPAPAALACRRPRMDQQVGLRCRNVERLNHSRTNPASAFLFCGLIPLRRFLQHLSAT